MEELIEKGDVEMIYKKWLEEMYARARELGLEKRADNVTASMGYVTTDVSFCFPSVKLYLTHQVTPSVMPWYW